MLLICKKFISSTLQC